MQSLTIATPLENFLQQPNIEASPAWEFINEQAQQKPRPTLFHSRLQRNLVNAINRQTQDCEAIQELRCIVPPMSPVPDIAVVKSDRPRVFPYSKKTGFGLNCSRFVSKTVSNGNA